MAINPLGSHHGHHGAQRAGEAAKGQEAAPTVVGSGKASDAGADQLLLSDAAATAGADSAVPGGELTADALRVITQRIATGAYDTPAAADRLAGKLLSSGDL